MQKGLVVYNKLERKVLVVVVVFAARLDLRNWGLGIAPRPRLGGRAQGRSS